MRRIYPALRSPIEGGGFVIRVPDVSGCVTTGKTEEEALENIRDALAGCLLVLEDVGQPLPEPSSPDAIEPGGATVIRVDVDPEKYRAAY
ncbi:MAG: type II toxin-antitoxin system HicB family antitoxin [Clostridia bacterium]|nr:type II toxin-antitoxin system HicB family antitoxin [Clostridia bacterium]